MSYRCCLRAISIWLTLLLIASAYSHPANVASSQIKVQPDGTYVARVRFDVLAFATGASPREADDGTMNALLDGPDTPLKASLGNAESQFRAGFTTQPAGTIDQLSFPSVDDVRRYLATNPDPRLPLMMTVTVTGHLPLGSRTIAFRYPAAVDTVIQTVEFPYREPISEPVESGQTSSTLSIPTAADVARAAAEMNAPRTPAKPAPAPPRKPLAKTEAPAPVLKGAPKPSVVTPTPATEPALTIAPATPKVEEVAPPPPATATSVAPSPTPPSPVLTYLRMGFRHILPQGLDHILFVLGLFLLGTNMKALIKQITAFTVAHSISLALATLGIFRLPGRIVEPLIAASIVLVAVENLFVKEVKPWRPLVVFLFGLVHGMGFAEVFADAGLKGQGLVTALLSFNVGVEGGQLAVVALAFLAVGWLRRDERYRSWIVVPGSLIIAGVALVWTAQRVFA